MATGPGTIQHLYLVRHGETALNAEGRLRGLANPPLNDVGIREAKLLAEVLVELSPAAVFSSPLDRAVHTARIIADRVGIRSAVDARFNDRDYGPQTGQVKAAVISEWGSVDQAPGVEPLASVLARARPALDDVLDAAAGSSVVVVTHDAVIRPLIEMLVPSRVSLTAPTGSWNDLARADGIWVVLAVDQKPGS